MEKIVIETVMFPALKEVDLEFILEGNFIENAKINALIEKDWKILEQNQYPHISKSGRMLGMVFVFRLQKND